MSTWWGFFAFYAVGYPIGIGFIYWPTIICSWEWFPERKGMISGLTIGSFGMGAFIFNFITTAIVNPDNLKPGIPDAPGPPTNDNLFSIELAKRVPYMMNFCLAIWAALALVAMLTVTRNPEYGKQVKAPEKPSTEVKDEKNVSTVATEVGTEKLVPVGCIEAFTSIRFWF